MASQVGRNVVAFDVISQVGEFDVEPVRAPPLTGRYQYVGRRFAVLNRWVDEDLRGQPAPRSTEFGDVVQ